MDNFETIFWHDSQIDSVVELPSKDLLVFNVQYPTDWENNKFVPKSIIFTDYFLYEIDEIPFEGKPIILDAKLVSETGTPFQKSGFFKVKIETNAGNRFVTAKSVKLGEQHVGI